MRRFALGQGSPDENKELGRRKTYRVTHRISRVDMDNYFDVHLLSPIVQSIVFNLDSPKLSYAGVNHANLIGQPVCLLQFTPVNYHPTAYQAEAS